MSSNSAESTGKSVKLHAYYIKLLILILLHFLIKSGRSMAAHTHTLHACIYSQCVSSTISYEFAGAQDTHPACMHLPQCVCTQQFPMKETGCACSRYHANLPLLMDTFITLHITCVTTNAMQNTSSGRCPFLFILIALMQPLI